MKLLECTGTLLLFDVPAADGESPAVILHCSHCDAIFVGKPDERHADGLVLNAD